MRTPESIIGDEHLRASVRYAAARSLIEKETHCRKEKRDLKFFIIQRLGGKHFKGQNGKRDYVAFSDGTKAVF